MNQRSSGGTTKRSSWENLVETEIDSTFSVVRPIMAPPLQYSGSPVLSSNSTVLKVILVYTSAACELGELINAGVFPQSSCLHTCGVSGECTNGFC